MESQLQSIFEDVVVGHFIHYKIVVPYTILADNYIIIQIKNKQTVNCFFTLEN